MAIQICWSSILRLVACTAQWTWKRVPPSVRLDQSSTKLPRSEQPLGRTGTMTSTNSEQVVRECAVDIIKITQTHKDDNATLIKALEEPLRRIVALPDLLSLGVKRQGNHIDNSKYLYYDGQLVISL